MIGVSKVDSWDRLVVGGSAKLGTAWLPWVIRDPSRCTSSAVPSGCLPARSTGRVGAGRARPRSWPSRPWRRTHPATPRGSRGRHHLRPLPWSDFAVRERLEGTSTTDFGAPAVVATRTTGRSRPERHGASRRSRKRRGGSSTARRDRSRRVRKGPRGGGRDPDAVASHVLAAEVAYPRKLDSASSASPALTMPRPWRRCGRPSPGSSAAPRRARHRGRRPGRHAMQPGASRGMCSITLGRSRTGAPPPHASGVGRRHYCW